MKGKRELALLAILVACGLRRHEAVELNFGPATTGGPLGDYRLNRESLSRSDHPGAGLGQESRRRLAALSRDLEWENL
jgi:hypothetical protein